MMIISRKEPNGTFRELSERFSKGRRKSKKIFLKKKQAYHTNRTILSGPLGCCCIFGYAEDSGYRCGRRRNSKNQ